MGGKVTHTDNLPVIYGGPRTIAAVKRGVQRTLNVIESTAKKAYKDKRISQDPHSAIIAGFVNTVSIGGQSSVKGIVFIGGPYYSIYVNDGHMLRNGAWWEGYHFMEAGAEAGDKVFERYITEELIKIGQR